MHNSLVAADPYEQQFVRSGRCFRNKGNNSNPIQDISSHI
jgi:hypothetical protein